MMKKERKKKETVIVFSAHSDDFVIGAGGTIAEYAQQGKKVIAIIMSYGERSHPWLKGSVVQKMRSAETFEAGKVLRCKSLFFNLREGKFIQDYEQKNVKQKIEKLVGKEKPSKIFTHSEEDPHPDHKATHRITLELYEQMPEKPEVYVYSVWNPVSFKTRYPSLYTDISKTLSTKLKALRKFKSQKIHVAYPLVLLLYRAFKDGLKIRKWFGEHFFRIK